ncbi:MAG TPA: hypothetical protein VMU06_20655 [Stellaceae bacterium]|nr:hypothetical protein [Stellaceae bacterium]
MTETGQSSSLDRVCRISINPGRSSSLWWDSARARVDAPAALGPMLELLGQSELLVTAAEAKAIREWAGTVTGWNDAEPPIIIESAGR